MDDAHLRNQLAHILSTSTRCGLIGHRGCPFNQVILEQATQAHEHQRYSAVATDPVLTALGQRILDHVHVDRVENDHGVVGHAQRGSCVDPVTIPASSTQLGENFLGIVPTLAGNDDFALLQGINRSGVQQRQRSFLATENRGFSTSGRCRKIDGINVGKITLLNHALHKHGTNHTPPADQTNLLHDFLSPN